MKLKLDENLGCRGRDLLARYGHDVLTVVDQKMESASDNSLIEVCKAEGRALVTLDLDFANPVFFPPDQYHGIAVLRWRGFVEPEGLSRCIETLAQYLASARLDGALWVVEPGRVREYSPD